MKKFSYMWIALGMAFLLLIPIYSTAQTQLILESSSGDRIGSPSIKSFSLSDNKLVIYLNDPFTWAALSPSIWIDSTGGYSGCTVIEPATVTAIENAVLSFKIVADQGSTITNPFNPDPCGNPPCASFTPSGSEGVFSWNTSGIPKGSYLAVFEAASGPNTSQLVVMINIVSSVQYTLTTQANPGVGGTVTGGGTYNGGTQAQVQANANTGYTFTGWSGDASGTTNPLSVTMNGNKTIIANFSSTAPTSYTLTVNVSPTGAGTVSPSGGSYAAGTTVALQATPATGTGNTFTSWTEGASIIGTNNPINITMNSNRTITANFSSSTPPPGMTGRWAAQVASATKLNGTTGRPGYYGVEYVGINMNQTKYFLIDPKNFNIPHAGAYIFGWVMDLTQCAGININYPRMIKLNANADEITWWYLTGACSYSLTKAYSSTDWNNGVMFLIEVTEMGRGSSAQGLNIYWQYR